MFGTEKDRHNCPFYYKMGACRHGDACSRAHNKPQRSETILFKNMYVSPASMVGPGQRAPSLDEVEDHFEDFYEDVFEELSKFGKVSELVVCENAADHLSGNVYARFARDEGAAAAALEALNGRYYAGRTIVAEFSPVHNFREATCRQHEDRCCTRGGQCNFMHMKAVGRKLHKQLFGRSREDQGRRERGGGRPRDRSRERSRSPRGRKAGYRRDDGDDRRRRRDSDEYYREESDAERRAKIARWNEERKQQKLKEEKGGAEE
ncbi:small subunit of U2 snRNP auxiliary factor [Chloropicon primus]|uniref:Small subunit of U2 snRNP auxiliary factor n=1 Tax=Chloropicon primus TaxID=1764295 RepID=A0A5B8N315_9CHLO|nr:small subunit of U2 snRNP auxiliary factor [Chloropicon primus]|eukprot:QDZ26084.1 small subunit of U2 snRNP auxiliary factor [Chloropicon primus]